MKVFSSLFYEFYKKTSPNILRVSSLPLADFYMSSLAPYSHIQSGILIKSLPYAQFPERFKG